MRIARLFAGSHRRLRAAVVTGVIAVTGAVCVGVALGSQSHAPEPPLSAAPPATSTPAPRPTTITRPTIVGPILPASPPVSLAIPAIGVWSNLLSLGRTSTGALEVPPEGPTYNQAGWYRYSPTPGALGPAVIAGHVDSARDGPSVFYRLGGLHAGDRILVARKDGSIATFTVDDVHRFHKAAFPSAFVYGNTNHAALRLVTCGGAFDSATGHYLDNIVVRASLVSATKAKVVRG